MARNRRRKSLPQDPVVLEIEKLSHEGRGISHLDGKVVFVDEALPGEQVSARYTGRRDSFDEARAEEILRASPHRVTPHCGYAGICGGCSLQHFDSEAQLAFKEEVLHEKLRHSTGRDDYQRLPPITGPAFGYRRKARLAARYVHAKERVLVGFREKRGSFITCMDSCEVLDPRAAALLPELSALIGRMDAFRDIPQIEVAAGDADAGGHGLALVLRHMRPLGGADLERLSAFAAAVPCDLYLQPGGPDTVAKLYPEGTPERLYYRLPDFDLDMAFHPMDFTQVNFEINRRMLNKAVELLQLQPGDRVLDLFCGLGNFTLPLARRCREAVGVEGVGAMVERGRENAARNAIGNAAFHCVDLSAPMTGQAWMAQGFDKVLLDPPRSGAREVLADVAACRPKLILYISCNPATLARDAGELEILGYRLRAAGVLDMFPQTTHVESIALFAAR